MLRVLVIVVGAVGIGAAAWAQPADGAGPGGVRVAAVAPLAEELPSAVASRVKKIERALTAADEALEAGRLQTAQRKLKETARPLKEIADRYAGKFDESDEVYEAMLQHLAATRERVTVGEQATADAEGAQAQAQARHEALCQVWIDKLGPFVDRRSEHFLPIAADLNRLSPEDQARARASYAQAKPLFEEYRTVAFARAKTIALKNLESSLTSTMSYYGAMEADAEQTAACKQWVDLLAPYVDVGMHSDRFLIAAPTMDTQQIERQQALYDDARAIFALYRKAELPLGKTHRLRTLEDAMARTLEEFPRAMAQSQAMLSGDVATRLDRVLQHLRRDTAWQQDAGRKPHVIMERDLAPLREAIERFAATVASGDASLVALRNKLATIEQDNAERLELRAERTLQSPDGYRGADLQRLKDLARSTAAKAHPGSQVHLVTVRSPDWSTEDVVEWTDTSRTALRRRITRSVRGEVALLDADGAAWLREVYLGQDKLPDGGWGALKAHTTWVDAMAVGNLGKTGGGTAQ